MSKSLTTTSAGRLVPGPVVCVVMDGIGVADEHPGNAVALAETPVLDALKRNHPYRTLMAHGTHVGMPTDEDMGNSEVGHNALGAGRIFDQGAKLVENAIGSGALFEGEVWKESLERCRHGGTLHFLGLTSDGNVHSHIRHLRSLIERALEEGISRIRVHALLDGRDVGEYSALDYVGPLETWFRDLPGDVRIATGGGRMLITMDRYGADWAMVQRGWDVHVEGRGPRYPDAVSAIRDLREKHPGTTDQWLPAFVVEDPSREGPPVQGGDSVILFNFRGDRAIEISQAFEGTAPIETSPRDVLFAGMMEYDGDLKVPRRYLVDPPTIDRPLGQCLAESGLRQLACSETQKFGHVTFFWNGNRSGKFDEELETYIEVPSDNVPFDQRPQMKAREITDVILGHLDAGFDHIRLNYANGDMVGHTGDLDAAVQAVSCVDTELGRLIPAVLERRGALLITADHGNADVMFTGEGSEVTVVSSHTLNPVPCHLVLPRECAGVGLNSDPAAGLANVAATLCQMLGFKPPKDYLPSLIVS